jgi:predicted flap endonuclease-1-like 5' DNA nuclease
MKNKRMEIFKRSEDKKGHIYCNTLIIVKRTEIDSQAILGTIGAWMVEKLNTLDYYTFQQINNFTEPIEYFPVITGFHNWRLLSHNNVLTINKNAERFKRLREKKERFFYEKLGVDHRKQAISLTLIMGVYLWAGKWLNKPDIYSYGQIRKLRLHDVEISPEILEIPPGLTGPGNWANQAHRLAKKQVDQVMS